ncbi:MAG: hypothetical protein WD534_04770 [Phycisphaeraceae bacterium]
MIALLLTGPRKHTHRVLRHTGRFDLRLIAYQHAFRAKRLPRATYIFTDFDRLNFWELQLAGRLHRHLAAAGLRVLNDPARVRHRYSLLRTLHAQGINHFNVHRVDEDASPHRYPLFLRTESAHQGPLSDLLHTPADVQRAVDDALAQGIPRRELLLVEYAAEPVRDNLFRKLAIYRVGDRLVPAMCAHDARWCPKYGQLGAADQALYDDEHDIIQTNRYADALRPAFDAGEIAYGRADFGLVDGQPQVYEINTNPALRRPTTHPYPIRLEAARLAFDQLADAFAAIDTPAVGRVAIDDDLLAQQRRHDRYMTLSRWTP